MATAGLTTARDAAFNVTGTVADFGRWQLTLRVGPTKFIYTYTASDTDGLPQVLAGLAAAADKAIAEGARRLVKDDPEVETTTVSVRRGTLTDESEVEAWIEEHGAALRKAVVKGPVILK